MKNQLNTRISDVTRQQLTELCQEHNETQAGVISVAIDRMWKEEMPMLRRANQSIQINDLIGIDGATAYNHGCQDHAVLRYQGDGKGVVIAAQSCHSCWQVGHGSDHVFAEVGQVQDVNLEAIRPASDRWATTIKWEM